MTGLPPRVIIWVMRLLVVEDEPDLLRRLAKILRAEGYAVDTAADGAEGLRKALDHDYDAILLDAMLPVFLLGICFSRPWPRRRQRGGSGIGVRGSDLVVLDDPALAPVGGDQPDLAGGGRRPVGGCRRGR